MTSFKILAILVVAMLGTISTDKANDNDEDKPYEFSFTIRGEQHRKESKDVNGIIRGEFGFITADGVYHVTVYATDENGLFHIISMKNIRLGDVSPEDAKLLPPTTPQPPRIARLTEKPTTIPPTIAPAAKTPSCASCKIPKIQPVGAPRQPSLEIVPPKIDVDVSSRPEQPNPIKISVSKENNIDTKKFETGPQQPSTEETPIDKSQPQKIVPLDEQNQISINPALNNNGVGETNTPAKKDTINEINDIKLVGKYENMKDGLPDGIKEKDISDLLYKFNYTIGFHGHYEKGYKDGSKIGGYFVNGRDGISVVVTYVADLNGYHPKVRFINLGLDSPDTPKEETEKTFGLKNFEFVWYPVK